MIVFRCGAFNDLQSAYMTIMGKTITPSGLQRLSSTPIAITTPTVRTLPVSKTSSVTYISNSNSSEKSVISIPDTAYIRYGPAVANTTSGSII